MSHFYKNHIVQQMCKKYGCRNGGGGNMLFSNGCSNSRGVIILFSRDLNYNCIRVLTDTEGRYIIAHIDIGGTEYLLCNLYAPTQGYETDQLRVMSNFMENINDFEVENILIGGDFNEVLNPLIDRRATKNYCNLPWKS